MEKPSFFKTQPNIHTTSEIQSPQDIKLLARPDMALAVFLTDKLLAKNKAAVSALQHVGMKSLSPNLSTPQAVLGWLYTLSTQLKQFALTLSPEAASPKNIWLFQALSSALKLDINTAISGNPNDFAYATHPEKPYQIIATGHDNEVSYTVPVRFGVLFECLKQHTVFRTDNELDAALEKHIAQHTKDRLETQKQFSLRVDNRVADLGNRMTTEEMESFYIENYGILSKLSAAQVHHTSEQPLGATAHLSHLLQHTLTAHALSEEKEMLTHENTYTPMGLAY